MRHILLGSCVVLAACTGAPRTSEPTAAASASGTSSAEHAPRLAPAATNVELPSDVAPTRYRLTLDVDPTKDRFTGEVAIDLDVLKTTDTVVLHARDISIRELILTHEDGSTSKPRHAMRRAVGARDTIDELVVLLDDPIRDKTKITLTVRYDAPFALLNGLYRTEYAGEWFAFTQMEPNDARRMFPSFDEPRHKTPFEIMVRAPSSMVAISNGTELERTATSDDFTSFKFAPTEPIPTYLIALAVGPLEIVDGAKQPTPIRLATVKGRSKLGPLALDAAQKSLAMLEQYFGRDYPYKKLDIAAVPNFGPGAMENAGLVTFREELVLTTSASPAIARRRMRLVMAHELAHQWFGNLVTMRWWDDLWLNEGFATWMAPKACDEAFPEFGGRADRVIDKSYAITADVLPSAQAVRPVIDAADKIRDAGGWTAYTKGAAILSMLEAWLGDEAFKKSIRAYVDANANRSITSKELFQALDTSTNLPVSKVASSFLDQSGVPLLDMTATCDKQGARLDIAVSDMSGQNHSWAIPVCLRADDQRICTVVEGAKAKEPIVLPGKCPVVVPNAGETGYYRYRLDPASAGRLEGAISKLDETERAGLLLNAWSLALVAKDDVAAVIKLIRKLDLPREKSRVVLESAILVLTEIERTMLDEASRASFRKLIVELLGAQRKLLGSPKDGEPDHKKLARVSVLTALYEQGGDGSIIKELEPIAKAYLEDPSKADPDLGPLAIRVSTRTGGVAASVINADKLANAASPDERVALIGAIFSHPDPAKMAAGIDLVLNGTIRSGDFRHVRWSATRRPDTRAVFFQLVRDRFDALVEKLGSPYLLVAPIREICDQGELTAMASFLSPRLAKLEGAQRAFDEGVAEAKRCIDVKERSSAQLTKALAN